MAFGLHSGAKNAANPGALRNLGSDNVKGPCASPVATVWSLHQPVSPIPQATFSWQETAVEANISGTASLNLGRRFANCFSFERSDVRDQPVEGGGTVKVASCHCPLGEDVLSALPAKPSTGFITSAGGTMSDPRSYCYHDPRWRVLVVGSTACKTANVLG